MKILQRLFWIGILFFSFLSHGYALEVPPSSNTYVSDKADLLSIGARAQLEKQLKQLDDSLGVQFLLVTFPSLEGDSLEDFSIRLAQAWKPGQKNKDNGLIFLIFKNDRKMRIEVGYGLEGVLTDALCGQIIRDEVAPAFKSENYDLGISKGVDAVIAALGGTYQPSASSNTFDLQSILLLLFFLFFMFPVLLHLNKSGSYTVNGMRRRRRHHSWGSSSRSWSGGGGFSGGGFSGGGGRFGGGGASGSW